MSDDPSYSDTPTLVLSIRFDIGRALARLTEAGKLLDSAMATAWEVERRLTEDAKPKPEEQP